VNERHALIERAMRGTPNPLDLVIDIETTGMLQRYGQKPYKDVGISQLSIRQRGRSVRRDNRYHFEAFSDILLNPLEQLESGRITEDQFHSMLSSRRSSGVRWQEGYRQPGNVLEGVYQRHLDMTKQLRSKKLSKQLMSERAIVDKMTKVLEAGHTIRAWNIEFDLMAMGQAAARANPALYQRWSKAVNVAREAGRIKDMGHNVRQFAFLAAQESYIQEAAGRPGFFTLGQLHPEIREAVRKGEKSVAEVNALKYADIIEPHGGFGVFLKERAKQRDPWDYPRYMKWLEEERVYSGMSQPFKMGHKWPDIRYAKGWSVDIMAHALTDAGQKPQTLLQQAAQLMDERKLLSHESTSDTVLEEVIERIFEVKKGTSRFDEAWEQIAPRLKAYGIREQDQFFRRYEAAIEWKGKSQLYEVAREAGHKVDVHALDVLGQKVRTARAGAPRGASAAAHQPLTLRRIYGEAGKELQDHWAGARRKYPRLSMAAAGLAAFAMADALLTPGPEPIPGLRDPDRQQEIDGIVFGPLSQGSARALTDFGSGRLLGNATTRSTNKLMAYRASLAVRHPGEWGIGGHEMQEGLKTWMSGLHSAHYTTFTRGDYDLVRGSQLGTAGINRSAWYGVVDLDDYSVKVDDADTLVLHRKGILNAFRRPIQVRLAGIDAPEVEHPDSPIIHRIHEDQFAGKAATQHFEQMLEKQQSMRLLIDPSARTYNRNLGVLIGDRGANLNLQLLRSGAAAALPWGGKRGIMNRNMLAEAEAKAAAGGIGMWSSKGWQMHRAMGLIAGQRVTNVTLTDLDRIAKSASLTRWAGLVQEAHDQKGTPYTPTQMEQMYQIGTAYRAEVMSKLNRRTKDIGFMPGLRDSTNPWQIAGHGINPSKTYFGNVSDFSSGRDQVHAAQDEHSEAYGRAVAAPDVAVRADAGVDAAVEAIEAAKSSEVGMAIERIDATVAATTPSAVSGATVMREVGTAARTAQARTAHMAVGGHPAPRPVPKAMSRPIVQPTIASFPAVKGSSYDVREAPVPQAIKPTSFRSMVYGPDVAAQDVNLAGLAQGKHVRYGRVERQAAYTMAYEPPWRSPGEFVAMKPHGEFVSSSKAYSWPEHDTYQDPMANMKKMMLMMVGLNVGMMAMHKWLHVPRKMTSLDAWDVFYNAQGMDIPINRRQMKQAHRRLYDGLKDQGFKRAEIELWMKQNKVQKGFINRIRKGTGGRNLVERLSDFYEGMRDWPDHIESWIQGKKSKLSGKFSTRVTDWFNKLAAKLDAPKYGLSSNDYIAKVKAGTLGEMKKLKNARRWSNEWEAGKYLWTEVVKKSKTFTGKIAHGWSVMSNVGQLSRWRDAHKAGLLDVVPETIKSKYQMNVFQRASKSMWGYAKRLPPTGRLATLATGMRKASVGLRKFGTTTAGKVLGKVPYANLAWAAIDGFMGMDQYTNAAKGFATEAAAGAAYFGVQTAFFRPSMWVTIGGGAGAAIGAAVGSLFAGVGAVPGTVIGEVVGTVIGTIAAAAASLIAADIIGSAAADMTRTVVGGAIGARKRRMPHPAAYMPPEAVHTGVNGGFQTMRASGPNQFAQFHGMDPSRPDMSPFGGAYNPIKGMDIDARTLQIANNRKRVTAKPRTPRPISMFTPTFGLVNNVLWGNRANSRVRSVTQKYYGGRKRPRHDTNRSRSLRRAA
jgi:endonuclease YncB( thermonuclease family)